MKTSLKFMLGVALAMSASSMMAQGNPKDEIVCKNENTVLDNNSLYTEYYKQKAYKDAYEFWSALYEAAPDYNKNLYICGETILKQLINAAAKEKNMEQYNKLVDDLLALYDNRIKYFGDDAKKPAATILGDKAIAYLSYKNKAADEELAYGWLEQVVNEQKDDADAKVLKQYVILSYNKFKKDPAGAKKLFIDNYMKGSELLDGALDRYQLRMEADQAIMHGEKSSDPATLANTPEKAAKDSATAKSFIDFSRKAKQDLITLFANSGAADVETLVSVFEPQVEEKKADNQFLKNVSKLLGRSKEGRETELYTRVAEYSYNIEPSMEAAKGLAQSAVKAKDWDRALKFYDEALTRAIQPDDKTEILKYEAAIFMQNKEYSKCREICRKSLAIDPVQADPHVMIANCYASSANSVGLDSKVAGLVFVAAVNELMQARTADPSRAPELNSTIAKYKAAYPEKGPIFMTLNLSSGAPFHIGGWMNVDITIPD
ncbi:MAG: hypothetical protein KBT20_07430 [Bacteroidales bacterium]|nr:hypothetical protein [Candidatus Liminaster caballi]